MIILGIFFALIICILPIIIIAFIISAISKKNKEEKSNFQDTIRNIYIYIILIIALITIITGIIGTFRIGLDLIFPEKSIYQTNDDQIDKNENIIELCTTVSFVLSTIPVFIYHNKLAKRNKASKI